MNQTVYNFSPRGIDGNEKKLEDYSGKVLLVVNTASKCGFTPQYEGLQDLYEKHRGKGLEILGFPCDQFANQEPGTESEIQEFCKINFGVTFPLFAKVDVNGRNADPLFSYLTKSLPGRMGRRVKWNFTKFLVDRDGRPVRRFSPATSPADLEQDIISLL